jgi:hypothetical protein
MDCFQVSSILSWYGWPDWCKTELQKQKYISLYEENEGIQLDYDAIQRNPGKRMLAKLMLNR